MRTKRGVGRWVSACVGVVLAIGSYRTAHACSTRDKANEYRGAMMSKFDASKYAEAEDAYLKLSQLEPSCIVHTDHSVGGNVARKLGDIHSAIARYTTAGNTREAAMLKQAYGVVRINGSTTAPTPRGASHEGVAVFTQEAQLAFARFLNRLQEPGRAVGYLVPATYVITSGQRVLLRFTVKGGETLILSYP